MVSQSRHREKSKPVHQLLHTGPRTLSCLWSWSPTVEQTNIEALNAKNFIHWFNFKVNLENCCWISLLCTAVSYVKHNSPCIVSSPGIWPSDDLCTRGMTVESCSPQLLLMCPIQKLELILKLQLNHLTCKKSDIQQTCGVIRLFIHLQATANLIPHCFIPLVCLFWHRSPRSPWLWESQIHRPPCNREKTRHVLLFIRCRVLTKVPSCRPLPGRGSYPS